MKKACNIRTLQAFSIICRDLVFWGIPDLKSLGGQLPYRFDPGQRHHKITKRPVLSPVFLYLLTNGILRQRLFHGYCRDGTAVDRLLAVTGVAAIRVGDPGFVVPEFEHLGAEFGAEPATDAQIHVNFRGSHIQYHPFMSLK